MCNFNIRIIRGSLTPRAARVEPFDVFLFAAARLFTAAKGTEGGGVGSARLVRPLDVFTDAKLDQNDFFPFEKDRSGLPIA